MLFDTGRNARTAMLMDFVFSHLAPQRCELTRQSYWISYCPGARRPMRREQEALRDMPAAVRRTLPLVAAAVEKHREAFFANRHPS